MVAFSLSLSEVGHYLFKFVLIGDEHNYKDVLQEMMDSKFRRCFSPSVSSFIYLSLFIYLCLFFIFHFLGGWGAEGVR